MSRSPRAAKRGAVDRKPVAVATQDRGARIEKLTQPSLEERVYGILLEAIVVGEFRPGDALVEAQLSERFGVSKTPVREALIRLKRDELVTSELHHINRVATPTEETIRQACEMRMWIEAALAADCARNRDERLLRALEQSVSDAEAALSRDDERAYGDAVRSFSDAIVEASDNRYAREFLERLRNQLTLIAHVSRETPGRRVRSVTEHRAILAAIASGDPDAAASATRLHLESIEQDSIAAVRQHARETG